MSKQLKVDLLFQADVSAALNNIQNLNNLLKEIGSRTVIGVDSGSLHQATISAQELQVHLNKAVNVNTGKLDLNKLNQSLKNSNQSLQSLVLNLRAAGPTGEKAFLKMATAIASAETPMIRVNQRLKNFGVTLINTIKWQVASSAIQSVSGMLSSAVSHAESLNTALTDIRIVTGKSSEDMAKFAMQAQSAARALNTTTTEYAKAALIFYQQGLEGSQVTERANTVIKLAHVTNQSAEIVSDQMTAIWNNFDDGSKRLEYYADVLAKLGADTAASTDEIANGLSKFAAVADTVGLSYEYAAASVATVVDKTRQSADIVGTSFKTIFARMQGLSLGETLEDGVDLNKYSQALEKVGIEVLNAKGEMRQMDDILDELGEKWEGLGDTTQAALAQTIGGVRQYNQMIALMDNWDSVVSNINKAKGATEELAKQQAIWSESYEGASDRVKQAQNELYEKFVNSEAIVKLTDLFAHAIDGVSSVIDALGGVGPMLLMLLGIFSKQLFPVIQRGITGIKNAWSVWSGTAQQDVLLIQSNAKKALSELMQDTKMTEGQRQQIEIAQKLIGAKQELAIASKHMTTAQIAEAEARIQNYEAISAETQATLDKKVALEQELKLMREMMNSGSAKQEIATTSAINTFRKTSANNSDLNMDEVIADATSRSMVSVSDELGSLPTASELINKRYKIQKKIVSAQQSVNDLTNNYNQISDQNVQKKQEALKTLLDQQKVLEDLKNTLSGIGTKDEARRKHLEAVFQLQKKIVKESKKDISEISVGTISSSALSDSAFEEGEEQRSLKKGLAQQMTSQLQGGAEVGGSQTQIGEIVAEASLGNLEKLYTLMSQYKQAVSEIQALEQDFNSSAITQEIAAKQELVDAEKELVAAGGKVADVQKKIQNGEKKLTKEETRYAAALKKTNKASQQVKKSGEQSQKTLKKISGRLKELFVSVKGADAAVQDVKELDDAFEALGKGDSVNAMNTIAGKLSSLKTVFADAGNSADKMGKTMLGALKGGGFDSEQIEEFIQTLQELGIISAETAQQIRALNAAGDNFGGQSEAKGSKITGIIGGLGQIAGSTAMIFGTLSNAITTCFSPDTSGIEKIMSILVTLGTVLPIVAAGYGFLSAVMKVNNALQEEGVAVTGASIAERLVEIGVISKKTAATWADTIANIANLLSSPFTIPIAAVAIAAIAGICIWLGAKTAATENATAAQRQQNEADMEAAEKATELASKWAEQQDAMDGLIKKYKELKAAGDDYSETTENIIEAVPELLEAYRKAAEGVGLDVGEGSEFAEQESRMKNAAAAGDVEAIEEAQEKMDALISPEAADKAKSGYDAAVKNLGLKLEDTQGSFEDNKYTVNVGGYAFFKGKKNEETEARNILYNTMGSDNVKKGAFYDDVNAAITLDMSTSDQFMEDYEQLLAARDKMLDTMSSEELGDSGVYEEVNELIENTKEEYQKAKEMQAEAQKYGVYDAKSELEKAGMDITDIDSLKEYKRYRDVLLNNKNVKGDPEAEAIAKQWLEANANVAEYVKAEQKIAYVGDQRGEDAANKLTELYDSLDSEQKKLFLDVDFSMYQTTDAVKAELDRMQAVANATKIEKKIEVITTAKDSLKETGMTEDDWNAIKDSGIEWGKDGIIKFNEFINLTYQQQTEYLQSMSKKSEIELMKTKQSAIDSIQASLKSSSLTPTEKENLTKSLDTLTAELAILEQTAFSSATSLQELDKAKQQLLSAGMEVDYDRYAQGLINIASAYENCATEIENYNLALSGTDTKAVKKAEEVLRTSIMLGEAAEKYGIEATELEIQAAQLAKTYRLSAKEAAKLAIQNQRMNIGVVELNENWQDWKQELKKSDKTSTDYAKTAAALTKTIANLVGASEDLELSPEFLEASETLEMVEKAANGDIEAINALGVAVAKESINLMKLDADFKKVVNGQEITISTQDFETAKQRVMSGLDELQKKIQDGSIAAGDSVGSMGSNWVKALNKMALATNMSVEEMNALLGSMGVDAEVEINEVDVETKVPQYSTKEEVDAKDPTIKKTTTWISDYVSVVEKKQVATINSKAKVKYVGNGSVSSSSTGGGSKNSTPKKVEKRKTADRYTRVTQQLDNVADAITDANRAMDTLYGENRLKQMVKINALLENEVDLLKEKNQEAKNYLKQDKQQMLKDFAGKTKIALKFDDEGNVSNIEEIFDSLDVKYNNYVDQYNQKLAKFKKGGISDNEQKQLDVIQEKMDAEGTKLDELKASYDQYAETLQVVRDTENEIADKQNEIKSNNYQKMVDKMNLSLEKTGTELSIIEYYSNKIADDFYKMAEGAALLSGKMLLSWQNVDTYTQHLRELDRLYSAGKITESDYVEGKKETISSLTGELETLQNLDKEMLEYYGNTLAMAGEELVKYTEKMEQLTSVLEHYQSLLSIMGKEQDYDSMGVILGGIASTRKDQLDVSVKNYERLQAEVAEKKRLMDEAINDPAQFELYKKQWEDAEVAAREAEETMLSNLEAWGEAEKAVLDNSLQGFAKTLEQALTGGTSFDELSTQMERATSLQEEYLTTTNQIYETTKMMRTAQKAIDESTNSIAKQKLQNFNKETQQLQKQGKLSQYELDIQQAKYDLLLAEIALSEAQNAKSTVRLQRDSEGNFGYVYTADQNQVADAQQKLEDAENALYNKRLEGANDYAEKYQSTLNEMYSTFREITVAYQNGEIASEEEYRRKMMEAEEHYFSQLQSFSHLYSIASSGDSRVVADAWSTDFSDMIRKTDEWQIEVNTYTDNCELAFSDWAKVITEIEKTTGGDLDELARKVQAIADASSDLAIELTKKDGIIDGLNTEIQKVSEVTAKYAELRDTVLEAIGATADNFIPEKKDFDMHVAAYYRDAQGRLAGRDFQASVPTYKASELAKVDWTFVSSKDTPFSEDRYRGELNGKEVWISEKQYSQMKLAGFNTGGYTGEWGPDGKLAMLHQKEIVLNQDDTANLLTAVDMLRVILKTLDIQALSAQLGGLLSAPSLYHNETGVLEQNVKIEASFPGIRDRNELEEAFNNLINKASQYANRK